MQSVNERGLWLKNWATAQSLTIVNTCYEKAVEKIYTFVGPSGIPRQIDYLLVSKKLHGWVRDCETSREIDMNSDHKTLKMRINFQETRRNHSKKQESKKQLPMKWPPTSVDEYKHNLTKRLEDLMSLERPHLECKQIEKVIIDAIATVGQNST